MMAHCPRDDGDRECDIHGAYGHGWSEGDEQFSIDGYIDYRILQCRGCKTVFFWKSSTNSEDTDHVYSHLHGDWIEHHIETVETFPAPDKKSVRPDWAWTLSKEDATLSKILNEVYVASEAGSLILASVGLRTALDRTAEKLGIDPAIPMEKKVKALLDGGWIGETEAQTLGVVAEAGNAAAHRGWAPGEDEFKTLLRTLEQFIERALLSGKKALDVAPNIPARQRRARPAQPDPGKA